MKSVDHVILLKTTYTKLLVDAGMGLKENIRILQSTAHISDFNELTGVFYSSALRSCR